MLLKYEWVFYSFIFKRNNKWKGVENMKPVVIGVGGPVGSGKTLLIERLTRVMAKDYSCAVITNDI